MFMFAVLIETLYIKKKKQVFCPEIFCVKKEIIYS